MLNQFLVLGLVPGTNFQITFSEVLLFVLIIFSYLELSLRRAQILKTAPKDHFRPDVVSPLATWSKIGKFSMTERSRPIYNPSTAYHTPSLPLPFIQAD